MEFHFTSKLEEYYQKFIELQEKLKKSEEQRFVLEMKFNEMVHVAKEEEQAHYRRLRSQYKRFLEEDKKRQDRNERIIRNLERIETRISMLSAKTERVDVLRRQYHNFLQRIAYPNRERKRPDVVFSRERSFIKQEPLQQQQSSLFRDDFSVPQKPKETLDLKKPLFEQSTVKKNLENDQSNEEKIEILDRYLESISSQKCKDLLSREWDAREKLAFNTRPDILLKDDGPTTNHATTTADDIMNSIYTRHYNKNDNLPNVDREGNLTKSSSLLKLVERKTENVSKPSVRFEDNEVAAVRTVPNDSKGECTNIETKSILLNDEDKAENAKENENILGIYGKLKVNQSGTGQYVNTTGSIGQKDTEQAQPLVEDANISEINMMLYNDSHENKTVAADSADEMHERALNTSNLPTQEALPTTVNHTQLPPNQDVYIPPDYPQNDQNYEPGVHEPAEYFQQNYMDNHHQRNPSGFSADIDEQLPNYHQEKADMSKGDYLSNNPPKAKPMDYDDNRQFLQNDDNSHHTQDPQIEYLAQISAEQYVGYIDQNHPPVQQVQNLMQPQQYVEDEPSVQYDQSDPTHSQEIVFDEDRHDIVENQPTPHVEQISVEQYDKNEVIVQNHQEQIPYVGSINQNHPPVQQVQNLMQPQQYVEDGLLVQYDQSDPSHAQQNVFDEDRHDIVENQPTAHVEQITSEQYDENEVIAQNQQKQTSYVQPIDQNQPPIQQPQNVETGPSVQYDQRDPTHTQQILFHEERHDIVKNQENDPYYHPRTDQTQDQSQIHFDESGAYEQNGQPIQYDPTDTSYNQQYDENGQPLQYDQHGETNSHLAGYDQYGQPLLYDQHGQIVQPQYDENGQFIPQYDESGQLIMLYDQNGHQYAQPVYDENQQDYNYTNNQEGYDPNQDGENNQSYYNQLNENDGKDDNLAKKELFIETTKQNESGEKKEPKIVTNVIDILDTDTESSKQNTSKVSNDTDFDFN